MDDPLDNLDLAKLLKSVPQFQPRIVLLAWEVVNDNGDVVAKEAALRSMELTQAIHEVEEYSKDTKELIQCLKRIVQPSS